MTNNKFKILLVEDEPYIQNFVAAMLETSGYKVIRAESCMMAQTLYASYLPDLIILDLGLPDEDGMVFLRHVRESSFTPILVLSARSMERDKIEALDSGANDYVTKPFSAGELLARVRSLLRMSRFTSREDKGLGGAFRIDELVIDYDARQVFIRNKEIKLTQTEYNIVAFLAENAGRMMTYSAIIKAIWGGSAQEGSIKKLQVNMANIRKKFGATPGTVNYITNELGVGYRMNS